MNEYKEDNSLVPKESNILINLKDGGFASLAKIIRIIEVCFFRNFILSLIISLIKACKGNIEHLESRKSLEYKNSFDLLVTLNISSNGLLHLIKSMRQNNLAEITLLREKLISIKGWLYLYFRCLNMNYLFV